MRIQASLRAAFLPLLIFSGLMVPVTAAELTLRVQHFLGEESIPHRALIEPWARRIEQDSGGRIRVEIHAAMGLGGKARDLVDQVQEGAVDIVWTAAAYTPGRFPRTEVFSLPLVHRGDAEVTNLAIRDVMDTELYPDFEGLYPLLVHVDQGHAFHFAAREVTRLGDFAGLTLRPPGRGIGVRTVEALGAEPAKKRHPKLPRALANGDLDGALMSFKLAQSMGVIEAVKSHTLIEGEGFFGTSIFLFLMNQDRFDALPEDLRALIESNSGADLAREMGQVWQEEGDAALALAQGLGHSIHRLAGEEAEQVRQALRAVLSAWLVERERDQIDGVRLIRRARRAIARHEDSDQRSAE